MAEQKKLTGKRKIIVNAESYAHGAEHGYVASDFYNKAMAPHYILPLQYKNKDTLRVCLGHNWDLNKKSSVGSAHYDREEFDNLWTKPVVFFGSQLEIEYCNEPIDLVPQDPSGLYTVGSQQTINIRARLQTDTDSSVTNWQGESLWQDEGYYVWDAEKYNEKMNPQHGGGSKNYTAEHNFGGLNSWIFLMKTGLIDEAGRESEPVIQTNKTFYDHYHLASAPFNKTELLSKQPVGKMYYAKYNTFFNDTYDSVEYRKTLSAAGSSMNNSLPSIYAFLKLNLNKFASELDISGWRGMVENIFSIGTIPGKDHVDASTDIFSASNLIYSGVTNIYDYTSPKEPVFLGYKADPETGEPTDEEIWTGTSVDPSHPAYNPDVQQQYEILSSIPIISSNFLDVTRNYLVESLLTLFGFLGAGEFNESHNPLLVNEYLYDGYPAVFDRKIVEKIIFAKPGDVKRALYKKYFDDWAEIVTNGKPYGLNHYQNGAWSPFNIANGGMQDPDGNIALLILEKAFSNILFHENAYGLLQEASSYKEYFPFCNEIEFSTELFSPSADYMNQMKMTETIATRIANIYSRAQRLKDYELGLCSDPPVGAEFNEIFEQIFSQAAEGIQDRRVFYDLYEESEWQAGKSYGSGTASSITDYAVQSATENTKNTFDILELLQDYLDSAQNNGDYHLYTVDVRNYIVNIKNGLQTELLDENIEDLLISQIMAPAYAATIAEKYNQHKRNFQEIMEGKPAYAEDIMYVIRKVKLFTPWQSGSTLDQEPEEQVVQNIFFPNSTKLDAIKYIDTQVRYASITSLPSAAASQAWKQVNTVGYRYDIYAMRLVYGAKYHYKWIPYLNDTTGTPSDSFTGETTNTTNVTGLKNHFNHTYFFADSDGIDDGSPALMKKQSFNKAQAPNASTAGPYANNARASTGELDDMLFNGLGWENWHAGDLGALGTPLGGYYQRFLATVRVFVESDIKIIADKVFSTPAMYILDSPPMPPDVSILPYRAVNNKIKIILNAGIGEYRDEPVIMDDFDLERFGLVKQSQLTDDNKIKFASDTPAGEFQIFRTTKKPFSYADFDHHPVLADTSGILSKTSFEDTILPNKKYYYAFRAWEQNGTLVSNPSPVYEVELIDEQGAVKPVIRTVSFAEIHEEKTKEIQKYLYIAPSTLQLLFSKNENVESIFSEYQTNPTTADDAFKDKLQKKRFKIRLTSKSSGRKIDFNFSFNKVFPGGQKKIIGVNTSGVPSWVMVPAKED